ncbi:hypothetical protein H5410_051731 [Solanum commersonii]|uniref:Uncharacterized protein n=1 Tax=Solanum commersonii TaxID=4109 RepID=A0A9J5X1W0_SOLCO|nr:hypothetical protein H5410_051731 [Solanum commersonii]
MDVYVILRFHHEKLQQKPCIKYDGDIVTDCFEIGYNSCGCIVYIKATKACHVVEVKSDRDIVDIVPQLKMKILLNFIQTFEDSEGLGFEEVAQPQKPVVDDTFVNVGEELGEDLSRTSSSVGEDLDRTSTSDGEDLDGTSSATAAS